MSEQTADPADASGWEILDDHEKLLFKYAIGVGIGFAAIGATLGLYHGYGQRSITNYAGLAYDVSMMFTFVAVGMATAVVLLAALRGDADA